GKVGGKLMPENENLKDKKNGESFSMEKICNATWEHIYRFMYYKVQNREEAEDITQETYMKAISHLQKGSINPDKYTGFLKTVALNVLRDLWRKKKRRGGLINIDSINPKDSAMGDPTDISADRILINNALAQLNNEQRTVIELRIIKGYS